MGQDLHEHYTSARQVFEEADAALGFGLSDICFSGPEEVLVRTDNVQPAVLTTSIACLRAAQETVGWQIPAADSVAGHSLGEYTALVVAGTLRFDDALWLVRRRGELMYRAGEIAPGSMLALIGIDRSLVEHICRETKTEISNVNSPVQVVISGAVDALNVASALAKERGARRIIPLKVSGAFHSSLMEPVLEEFADVLQSVPFLTPSVPVVANVTGRPLENTQQVREELLQQLRHCIQWQACVDYMTQEAGITSFYEFGPGTVLTGLIRKIDPSVNTFNVRGCEDLAELESAASV